MVRNLGQLGSAEYCSQHFLIQAFLSAKWLRPLDECGSDQPRSEHGVRSSILRPLASACICTRLHLRHTEAKFRSRTLECTGAFLLSSPLFTFENVLLRLFQGGLAGLVHAFDPDSRAGIDREGSLNSEEKTRPRDFSEGLDRLRPEPMLSSCLARPRDRLPRKLGISSLQKMSGCIQGSLAKASLQARSGSALTHR